jgi:glycerol-3-phosphate dehydrogenase
VDGRVVAVLGAGPDACAEAVRHARAGDLVRLWAPDAETLAAAVERIRAAVAGSDRAERQRVLDGILATTDLDEATDGAATILDRR